MVHISGYRVYRPYWFHRRNLYEPVNPWPHHLKTSPPYAASFTRNTLHCFRVDLRSYLILFPSLKCDNEYWIGPSLLRSKTVSVTMEAVLLLASLVISISLLQSVNGTVAPSPLNCSSCQNNTDCLFCETTPESSGSSQCLCGGLGGPSLSDCTNLGLEATFTCRSSVIVGLLIVILALQQDVPIVPLPLVYSRAWAEPSVSVEQDRTSSARLRTYF